DLTMTLTCLQKIYSVLNHKARLERANGGKVSDSFVDTALTMGKRVLKDEKLAALLLKADEHPKGSPFDHYTKMQLLIQKGKSEDGIRWAFSSVWDGYLNKWLGTEFLSQRALKGDSFPGGTGALLVGTLEMKKMLLTSSIGLLGCVYY
ncbi:Gyltl1b, partial [Symbiodinium necroappetens]